MDHAHYRMLETAESAARAAYVAADRAAKRRRPPAGAAEARDAALAAFRAAGKARWDYEMADATIIDVATLPVTEWARAMSPRVGG